MKYLLYTIFCSVIFFSLHCSNSTNVEVQYHDGVVQYATLDALIAGDYDGFISVERILQKGSFGLGTFHNIDGEMLVLDGITYQIKPDGIPRPADTAILSPFAEVCFFQTDESFTLSNIASYEELQKAIDSTMQNPEYEICAVKIHGDFKYIKSRTISAQEKPYPPLSEVIAGQTVFQFENTNASVFGYKTYPGFDGVSSKGYHLHMLTDDKQGGGHLLECTVNQITVEIDYKTDFHLYLK